MHKLTFSQVQVQSLKTQVQPFSAKNFVFFISKSLQHITTILILLFFLTFHYLQSRAKFSMVTSSVLNFPLYLTVEKIIQLKTLYITLKLLFIFVLNLYYGGGGADVFFIMLKLVELSVVESQLSFCSI